MDNEFNFFNQYMDSQKKMMDMFKDMAKGFDFADKSMPFNMNFAQNPMDFFSKFTSITPENYFNYTGSPMEVINKVKQSSEIYYNLYKIYSQIYDENIEPSKDNAQKIFDNFKNQSMQYVNNFIFPFLPTDLQEIIKRSISLSNSYKNTLNTIYGPWADSAKTLADNFMEGVYKDPEAFLDYFDNWKKNYEKTFGKLLNIPQFGIERNSFAERMQTFDKFIRFITYYAELMIKLSNLVNETTENVINENFEMLKKNNQPQTFEQFYDYWKKTLSHDFDKLFYSNEFSKFLGNFVDSMMTLKIDIDKVLEDVLKHFPIPTKTDMYSLYKTVYDLKKEIRTLKRQIRDKDQDFYKKGE